MKRNVRLRNRWAVDCAFPFLRAGPRVSISLPLPGKSALSFLACRGTRKISWNRRRNNEYHFHINERFVIHNTGYRLRYLRYRGEGFYSRLFVSFSRVRELILLFTKSPGATVRTRRAVSKFSRWRRVPEWREMPRERVARPPS